MDCDRSLEDGFSKFEEKFSYKRPRPGPKDGCVDTAEIVNSWSRFTFHGNMSETTCYGGAGCSHTHCSRDGPDACRNHESWSCRDLPEPQVNVSAFCHDGGQRIDASAMLLHKMALMYGDSELSDLQLSVGTRTFAAHKLLLCMSSDVFKVMLTKPQWPESQRGRIVLKEEPQCIAVFELFLRYLYTGRVQLNHQNVMPLLMLADKYNVPDLRGIATEYMCTHVVAVVRQNRAVSWYQYAKLCNHQKVALVCGEFLCNNIHKVASADDFLCLEQDNLLALLENSQLVVPDEWTLYQGVLRWLHHQAAKLYGQTQVFRELTMDVLSRIRFPLMQPKQLRELELSQLWTLFPAFFLEKTTQAIRYHRSTLEERQLLANVSGEYLCYTPRNYTNDTWATALTIENFSTLPEHDVRPLFFSTPISGAQADDMLSWEWHVDLFPKGVHFHKCIMIGLWRNLEVCGAIYNTVRLTLGAKTPSCSHMDVPAQRHVEVAVLVTGVQDGVEYVRKVVTHRCAFDIETSIYNFDDLVPFEELNCAISPYLSGVDGNAFKITIVIKPLVV